MSNKIDKLKETTKRIPLINKVAKLVYNTLMKFSFHGSKEFWEKRYKKRGTSGPGSYGRLAEFKAEIVNSFVKNNEINSVIEFGCGDGNQLSLFKIPKYIGIDVSKSAIKMSTMKFEEDKTKSFFIYEPECFVDSFSLFKADATLSLDVIFHLIENHIFEIYLMHLFSVAEKYVIIYSSNTDENSFARAPHYKNRKFTRWIETNLPDWELIKMINNRYPKESPSDFFIYKMIK